MNLGGWQKEIYKNKFNQSMLRGIIIYKKNENNI
jgi:hypothetical protein